MVVFPAPVSPTMAIFSPFLTSNDRFLMIFSFGEYPKLTFSNVILSLISVICF